MSEEKAEKQEDEVKIEPKKEINVYKKCKNCGKIHSLKDDICDKCGSVSFTIFKDENCDMKMQPEEILSENLNTDLTDGIKESSDEDEETDENESDESEEDSEEEIEEDIEEEDEEEEQF